MTRVLITGGRGELGSNLVPRLIKRGYTVRVMSRSPRPAQTLAQVEWAQGDLETGDGLQAALAGVNLIVNSASSSGKDGGPVHTQQVDVDGTRHLLQLAQTEDVGHVIHVSIVGIDRIAMTYYKGKVASEAVIRSGGIPYTILRATQFHTLLDGRLRALKNWPIAPLPADYKFQSIETGEVAERLAELAGQPPAGLLLPDMGGPEVLTFGDMAKAWFNAQGKRPFIIPVPTWGAMADGFRNGYNTCPDYRDGRLTWADWVKETYK